jgi:hypothetical protein
MEDSAAISTCCVTGTNGRSLRYSYDDFSIEPNEVTKLRTQANEMLDLISEQIARRARDLVQRP